MLGVVLGALRTHGLFDVAFAVGATEPLGSLIFGAEFFFGFRWPYLGSACLDRVANGLLFGLLLGFELDSLLFRHFLHGQTLRQAGLHHAVLLFLLLLLGAVLWLLLAHRLFDLLGLFPLGVPFGRFFLDLSPRCSFGVLLGLLAFHDEVPFGLHLLHLPFAVYRFGVKILLSGHDHGAGGGLLRGRRGRFSLLRRRRLLLRFQLFRRRLLFLDDDFASRFVRVHVGLAVLLFLRGVFFTRQHLRRGGRRRLLWFWRSDLRRWLRGFLYGLGWLTLLCGFFLRFGSGLVRFGLFSLIGLRNAHALHGCRFLLRR